MTRLLVLAEEEDWGPQEDFGQALEVDSLELSSRQMAVTSDQMAGYYLPLRALGCSLAWFLVA